ncbi:hypothetical protein ACH5RR_025693 [Cinchona calisaya]|uniref:Retroviral polymerase SH3-like domain-containing protein n=1 Tax=Cinchona calisaya TaxID=153742 RepID=A0ABD2Z0D9_9GENT
MPAIPNYGHLRTFGCLYYGHVNSKPHDKFDPRAKPGIFIGYPNGQKGYKIYDLESKMIYVSCDVQFFEDAFQFANHSVIDLGQVTTLDHKQTLQLVVTKFSSPIITDESTALGSMPFDSSTESFPSIVTSPEQIISDPSITTTLPSDPVEPTPIGKPKHTIIPVAPVVSGKRQRQVFRSLSGYDYVLSPIPAFQTKYHTQPLFQPTRRILFASTALLPLSNFTAYTLRYFLAVELQQRYKVPFFPIRPLHKMVAAASTSFLEEDQSCISWLDKQAPNSMLYISLGSIAIIGEKKLTETAWGLANSGIPFLWVIRPDSVNGLPSEIVKALVGERGLIVRWAPQKKVLAHKAVGFLEPL